MLPSDSSLSSSSSNGQTTPLEALRAALLDARTAHPLLIAQLAPVLPESLLPRALAVALGLHDELLHVEIVQALLPRLKNAAENVVEEVLVVMRAVVILDHGETEPQLLETLLPGLSWRVLPTVLEMAIRIGDPGGRFRVLAAITDRFAPDKKAEMLGKALDVLTKSIPAPGTEESAVYVSTFDIIGCLAGLAPYCSVSLQKRLLEVARALPDVYNRCSVMARIVPHLPARERPPVVAEIGLLLWFEDERYRKMGHTSGEYRIDFRIQLSQTLPQPFKSAFIERALNLAYLMTGEPHKSALLELLPHLEEPDKTRVGRELLEIAEQLPEAIPNDVASYQRYGEHRTKKELLSPMWRDLPATLQDEALRQVTSLTDETERLRMFYFRLQEGANRWKGATVPPSLLEEALRQVRDGANSSLRVEVYIEIARQLPDSQKRLVIEEALSVALALPNRSQQEAYFPPQWNNNAQAEALRQLTAALPPDLLRRALEAALSLDGMSARAQVIEAMLPHLIVSFPEEVLPTAKALDDPSNRVTQLCRAVPYLAVSFQGAIYQQVTADLEQLKQDEANALIATDFDGAVAMSQYDESFGQALPLLCSEQPEATMEQLLGIADPTERANRFHTAAAYLAEPYRTQAVGEGIKAARASDQDYTRTRTLASLSSYLEEPTRSQVLQDTVDSMFAAAQNIAGRTQSDAPADSVEDGLFSDAIAQEGGPRNVQLDWLTDVAPYLTVPMLREAIARARELTDEIVRATTLSRLLAALAGLLPPGAERDALFYEALELAFLNPFFPERGGDGAPDEPEAVPVSPEYVKHLLSQLSPADQIAVMRDHLDVIGSRMGGSATQTANAELDRLARSKQASTDTIGAATAIPQSPIVVIAQDKETEGGDNGLPLTAATPRYLQSRFPTRVRLRERVPLQIRVSREGEASALLRDFSVPASGAELTLALHAPDFQIESERTQRLHLPANGDSDWALWEVTALATGKFPISVTAYNGAAYLGEITLSVESDEGHAGAEKECNSPLANRAAQTGDATLSIRYDDKEKLLRYRFLFPQDAVDEEVSSARLRRTPREMVESLVRDLNLGSNAQTNYSAAQTRMWLRGKGIELWRQLIPARLQELFWERLDQIERLTIFSRGDNVPWELLYPFDDNNSSRDRGFLSEQLHLARWGYGAAPTSALSMKNISFVSPEDVAGQTLVMAQKEVESLRQLLGTTSQEIRQLEELLECLQKAEFDLMHFACHHTFVSSSPSSSYVQMASQRFNSSFLEGLPNKFVRQPLVFMNACRSAGSSELYTDLSGWAEKFLQAGAGAFTGTFWDVRDSSAMLFAQEFYRTLLRGETLGRAMSDGRTAIKNESQDSTWLAYTLYGDLSARLSLPDAT